MAVNSNWISKLIIDNQFTRIVNLFESYDINDGPWIAGGAIRKLWQGLKWDDADIDIFFKNEKQYSQFCKKINLYKIKYINYSEIRLTSLKPAPLVSEFKSNNASTFTIVGIPDVNYAIKVQAICKEFYNSAEELFEDFDWTVCQLVSDGTTIWAPPLTVNDLSKRNLVLSPTTKRKIKIGRLIKYSAYGYKIDDAIMVDILSDVVGGITESIDDDY